MNKLLLSAVAMLVTVVTMAQETYNFSVSNEPYQNLTNSVSLNNGEVWDDPSYSIALGFNFVIGSKTISTIYINEEYYGGGLSTSAQVSGSNEGIVFLIAQDLIDMGFTSNISESPISYKVEGSTGSRIAKIEWKNVGFYDDSTGSDYMNFQLWLYEGSNVLEYRYGPNEINNPNESFEDLGGPTVGLFPSINAFNGTLFAEGYLLEYTPQAPTYVVFQPGDEIDERSLTGAIPDGTVYRFEQGVLSVNDNLRINFSLSPNPVVDILKITSTEEIQKIVLYNQLGQIVLESRFSSEGYNLSALKSGMYFISVVTQQGTNTKKLLKK